MKVKQLDNQKSLDMTRFYLTIFSLVLLSSSLFAQPTNDECITAIQINNTQDYCSGVGEFTIVGATPSGGDNPSCFPNQEDEDQDVWFSFTALGNAASIRVVGNTSGFSQGGTLEFPEFAVYSGTCGNLTEVECSSDGAGVNITEVLAEPLFIGAEYYIRVNARGLNEGTFQLCVNTFNVVPDPSSDCQTAVILCDKSSFTIEKVSGVGDNPNELDFDSGCNRDLCIMNEDDSSWYKWTCENSGTLTFDITPLNETDDIDFFLFELPNGVFDCSNKMELRCMASGENQDRPFSTWEPCTGVTGLRLGDDNEVEYCGCDEGDDNYVNAITMEAGKAYALCINNFSSTGSGFQMDFGGTGTFVGPQADFLFDPDTIECDRSVEFFDQSSYPTGNIIGRAWSFSGGDPQTVSGAGPHDVFFDAVGTKFISLTLETEEGCIVTQIKQLEVISCCEIDSDLRADIVNARNPNCSGEDNGFITAGGIGGDPDYMYSSDGINFQSNPTFSQLGEGTYDIYVRDKKGCVDIIEETLVEPPPILVEAGNDVTVDLGFTADLTATYGPINIGDAITWTPGDSLMSCNDCLTPNVLPPGTTTYLITVTDDAGCFDTDSVTVFVSDDRPVYIPNVFSPNFDGINDRFSVFGGPAIESISLVRVFDRWGTLMYETQNLPLNDQSAGWDGMFRGKAVNPGTYIYYMNVDFIDGQTILFEGDITVVR